MQKRIYILLMFLLSLNLLSAQSLNLKFNNNFNGLPLVFNEKLVTPLGDSIVFSTLNYFISNIQLVDNHGNIYAIPQDSSYFLLKQKIASNHIIKLVDIPKGKYKQLIFTIGVDSVRNTMDVTKRTGALDVGADARGMYWVWNSGYIFFKLEGKTVNQIDSLRKNFRYHIGGYGGYASKTINNIKVKNLTFNKLIIGGKRCPTINIDVNIDKFFDTITPVKIKEHPSVMWGDFSVKIANNYFHIFNLGKITYE